MTLLVYIAADKVTDDGTYTGQNICCDKIPDPRPFRQRSPGIRNSRQVNKYTSNLANTIFKIMYADVK